MEASCDSIGWGLMAQAGAPPTPAPVMWSIYIAAALVVGAALLGWWYRRRSRPSESRCGKCGYAVTGLPSFTCPECGSDLREVGIARGRVGPGAGARVSLPKPSRDVARLLGVLLGWSLLYGALYVFVGARSYPQEPWDSGVRPVEYGLVDAYLWPYRGKSTHAVTLEPRSGAYRRITVTERREARFRGWRHAPQVQWTGDSPAVGLTSFGVAVQIDTVDGKSATMEVEPRTLAWKYADPREAGKTASGGPLDADAFWSWMIVSGVDQPSPAIREEAETVVDLIRRLASSGQIGGPAWAAGRLERVVAKQREVIPNAMAEYPFAATRGTAQDAYAPALNIYWLSIPFGLGLYTYGTNWIFGRHRRRSETGPAEA